MQGKTETQILPASQVVPVPQPIAIQRIVPPTPPLPPLSLKPPKMIFLCLEEDIASAIKEMLARSVSLEGLGEEPYTVGVFREKWLPLQTLKSVVLVLNNHGTDTGQNKQISQAVSYILAKRIEIKIALPRREKATDKQLFSDLLKQAKGASRCARTLRGAITIEKEQELHPLTEPLQSTLQRLSEERERAALGIAGKEPIFQRIAAAMNIYEKGSNVERDNIVAVNLWLRGITYVPPSFRVAMLSHPDFTEEDNDMILSSEDKYEELSLSCFQEKSLKDRVLLYKKQYWKITSDTRYGSTILLELYNPYGKISLNMVANPIQDAFICTFKRYTRIIPFFDDKGVLTGIERAFFDSNASQQRKGALKTKLARGVTNGSSAILFPSVGRPKYKVLGEGTENVLSALEALRADNPTALAVGQLLPSAHLDEVQFCAALGVSDVIKVPIEESVHTIILIMDNDGYNMETKQTMIDTVRYFLAKNLKLYIIFAPSSEPGKKRDLNDVLREEGIEAVRALIINAISITSAEELGPSNELLQSHLAIAHKKKKLSSAQGIEKAELLLELGHIYIFLGRYDEALDFYYQAPSIICDQARQGSCTERLRNLAIQLYNGTASAHLGNNDHDQAFKLYVKALEKKASVASLQGIGKCYLAKGELTLAIPYLLDCPMSMGKLEAKRQNWSRAIAYFKRAISIAGIEKEPSSEIFTYIGDIHTEQKNYEQAIVYYKRAQTILNKVFCSERHNRDVVIRAKLTELQAPQKEVVINKIVPPSSIGRQVVMDLEMTGDVADKDRIIDIGCIVLKDHKMTDEKFQSYVNPGTQVRPQAHKLTGLTLRFLSDFPTFEEVAKDFLHFIENADLVFHGASSDIKFLTKELKRIGIEYDFRAKHHIIDTLEMAKALYPKEKNNLDALNKRLGINRDRPQHRALLDAEITSEVYIALRGRK